jgi:hypothetical protein
MRKLILFIVLGIGIFAFLNYGAVKAATAPATTALFNFSPALIQRTIFSTELPPDYTGTYFPDPAANADWARQQRYASQPQPTGHRRVELHPDRIVSHSSATIRVDPVAVVQKGDDFVVVEYLDRGGRTRIDRDDSGIWIAFEERAPRYKERYRRLR